MSGYTPVFDTVFDGTLCGRWPALPVWLTILPMADWRGHIELTPEAISARTGWPMDLLLAGIKYLCEPDPRSRSKNDDGRRLALLDPNIDWGWRVINIQKYRNIASGKDQVEDGRNAAKVRRYKERHRETPEDTAGHQETPPDTNSDSYVNINSDSEKNITAQEAPPEPEFLDFKLVYPNRAGDQGWRKAQGCWNARIKEGFTPRQMVDGGKWYGEYIRFTGNEGTEYVKKASTFLGTDKHFLTDWTPPKGKADRRLSENMDVAAQFIAGGSK